MNPNTRRYARVSAGVFAIVALLQGWRAARGFAVVIDGWPVPVALSWMACAGAAALAAWGWRAR